MPIRKREGNRPDRRIAPEGFLDDAAIHDLLSRITYVGSGNHKLRPGDYGFAPSRSPRPSKSPCDQLRPILLNEACLLFKRGIECGMVSPFDEGGVPKYVWALDNDGEVYEAKTHPGHEIAYHGYRIGEDENAMRKYITSEWRKRCR
jgi:hypothetical protein